MRTTTRIPLLARKGSSPKSLISAFHVIVQQRMGKTSKKKRSTAGATADAISNNKALTQKQQHRAEVADRYRRIRESGNPKVEFDRLKSCFIQSLPLDPWDNKRLITFYIYIDALTQNLQFGTDYQCALTHYKFLKTIRKSKSEPFFYRSLAYYASVFFCWNEGASDDPLGWTSTFLEKAIFFYDTATETDKRRIIQMHRTVFTENKIKDFKGSGMSVGDLVQGRLDIMQGFVKHMSEQFILSAWTPNGQLSHTSFLAGVICDFCGLFRGEVGEQGMLQCSKCQLAFYCSADCQRRAWHEHQHKRVCRKKGDFRVGDVAFLTTDVGDIRGNKKVQLIAPSTDLNASVDTSIPSSVPTRWIIKELYGNKSGIVPVENLKRVRSAVWFVLGQNDIDAIAKTLMEDADEGGEQDSAVPDLFSNKDSAALSDSDDESEDN